MSPERTRRALLLASGLALACGVLRAGPAAEPGIPRGRLPDGLRPLHYDLELLIDPSLERFDGWARIELELNRPADTLWLHGRDLEVHTIRVTPAGGEQALPGRWEQLSEDGVAAVRLPQPVGPGRADLLLGWSAPFGRTLAGLYRVDVGADAYAFTQFEAIDARRAFPGFDEPAFKTPFDVTLNVPPGAIAIANTPLLAVQELPEARRVRFEPTPPLPTYLLAWAVGPLDVVDAPALPPEGPRSRPVPFRGVAARGRGGELAYALRHTPALLVELERYFGSGYPYPKLDVIAVPDFDAGAMENVGAITFREWLLLLDARTAPEEQRRGFTYVMAHELAHQWFGNLVTMEWWDDLWLNEAFATWLGYRSVRGVHPEQKPELSLLEAVQGAMDADGLTSARSIRQPIASNHDIHNAFDAITYSKGAGVLGMFERWLGAETFRRGIRAYIAAHRQGSARTSDLLAALSAASGRDVAAPFETFLTQPGVPFLEVRTLCEDAAIGLRQSRYLPVGSTGDPERRWQVPVCVRYAAGGAVREDCTLLREATGRLPLAGGACPDWVMPNAGAAGYYRFTQPAADAARLLDSGWSELTAPERLALADSLASALWAGARPAAEIYSALPQLAADPTRAVAATPLYLLRHARERLADPVTERQVERFGRELYAPVLERIGWSAAPDEGGDTRLLRQAVVAFLAFVAGDTEVHREAARRGRLDAGLDGVRDESALDPELVEVGLAAALQAGGAPVFDALLAQVLASEDALFRVRRLAALGETDDPELGRRARELALDPRLRVNEARVTLQHQAARPESREATWQFVEANFDALVARLGKGRAGQLPALAVGFCDPAEAEAVEAFLAPRIDALEGGPRNLAAAVEEIQLCAALVEAQAPSARAFFASLAAAP